MTLYLNSSLPASSATMAPTSQSNKEESKLRKKDVSLESRDHLVSNHKPLNKTRSTLQDLILMMLSSPSLKEVMLPTTGSVREQQTTRKLMLNLWLMFLLQTLQLRLDLMKAMKLTSFGILSEV
jgi:hypothetical protein